MKPLHDAPPRDVTDRLEQRLGRAAARQRLAIEDNHQPRPFGQGLDFLEKWSLPTLLRAALQLSGLYGRGQRNAARVELRRNVIASPRLPRAFDGFTIIHLSDLHIEMSGPAMEQVAELVAGLDHDICVMTGDYRGGTSGPFEPALKGVAQLCAKLQRPIYGVLGNHDTIKMVPGLEDIGVSMLLNESVRIDRGDQAIYLAGIDDAHSRVANIEKSASGVPSGEFSILLSHTPEMYRQASSAGFDAILAGHTHGGQICLPGGIPITLDSALPRAFGAGPWKYNNMTGYTSVGAGSCVVAVRLNCPPEITLHRLQRS